MSEPIELRLVPMLGSVGSARLEHEHMGAFVVAQSCVKRGGGGTKYLLLEGSALKGSRVVLGRGGCC